MFFQNLQRVLRQNIREYGMYIALFVIMVIFTATTEGVFISSRNLSWTLAAAKLSRRVS